MPSTSGMVGNFISHFIFYVEYSCSLCLDDVIRLA